MSTLPKDRNDTPRLAPDGAPEQGPSAPIASRRLAIAAAVLTLLVAADALYMQMTHYGGDDRGNFNMSFATTMWIAAGLLLLVTIGLVTLSSRGRRRQA